jgi:hypothetical protein
MYNYFIACRCKKADKPGSTRQVADLIGRRRYISIFFWNVPHLWPLGPCYKAAWSIVFASLPVVTDFPPSYSCILGCFVQIKSLGNVRSGKEYVQTRIVEISYLLCETSSQLFSCGLLITLMMEAVCTSETSVYFHEITRHYIP